MFRRKPCSVPGQGHVCIQGEGGWADEGCSSPKILGNRTLCQPLSVTSKIQVGVTERWNGNKEHCQPASCSWIFHGCVTSISNKSTEVSKHLPVDKNQHEEIVLVKSLYRKMQGEKCGCKEHFSLLSLVKNIKNEDFTLREQTFWQVMLMVQIIWWFEW